MSRLWEGSLEVRLTIAPLAWLDLRADILQLLCQHRACHSMARQCADVARMSAVLFVSI